jgi:hypothetical protein
MTLESRTCRFCSELFVPFRKNQDFCSISCRESWWSNHWKHEPHKCPQCGTFHLPVEGSFTLDDIEAAAHAAIREAFANAPKP